MALLEVDSIQVRYGQVYGTKSVSLTLDSGQCLALVGSNGSGKSSTLKAIMGMVGYTVGDVRFAGASLKGKRAADISRLGIGLSPEGRRVFPLMSVLENLRVGAYTAPAADFAARVEQIFGYFPRLKERMKQRASSLSGGEQQMLAIGRALMARPKILLLDEPSLGLAPIITERIGELLIEIRKREGMAMILAEQNANWALRIAPRAVLLELGTSAQPREAAELLEDPEVQRAYLGV